MVLRIDSPPGTSPTPVLPALSVRITMLRVKNGPCAPLRFISMLSRPATGTTRNAVTVGVTLGLTEVIDMVFGTKRLKRSQRCAGYMVAHHIAIDPAEGVRETSGGNHPG